MTTKYAKGLCRIILTGDGQQERNYLRSLALQCEEFILAIPDKWIYARIFGNDDGYEPEEIRALWMDYRWIADVVVIDREHMRLEDVSKLVKFDALFYGCEYGQAFENDVVFCRENKIAMVSLLPEKYVRYPNVNALGIALKDVPCTKKIVLFGTGIYFDIYMRDYGVKYKPAYAIDNACDKWDTVKQGVPIYSPEILQNENVENVLIIICSKNYKSQKEQLLQGGKWDYRLLMFHNEIALFEEFLIAAEKEKRYMEKTKVILKRLMAEFDRVCSKYHLRYYVISGSLIGVVRHRGMIPWDDDLDVGMPRQDLEKLKEIAPKEWNGEEFLFANYDELGNDIFHDLMPRLYYTKEYMPTRIMDKSRGKITKDVVDKLILDIYPMDNASDNRRKHQFNMLRIKFLYNLLMGHRGCLDYNEYAKLPKWKIGMIRIVNSIGRKISFRWLVALIERAIQCENFHDTESFFMSSGPIYFVERTYKKEFFGEGQMMEFEGLEVSVPQDYSGLLHAQCYGDFMQFPPYAVRKPSHYFNADISIW